MQYGRREKGRGEREREGELHAEPASTSRRKKLKMGAKQLIMLFKAEAVQMFVEKYVRAPESHVRESGQAGFYTHLKYVSLEIIGRIARSMSGTVEETEGRIWGNPAHDGPGGPIPH